MKLDFGTLKFSNEEEYYEALGYFCNRNAFSISYEPNKATGSYADAYRIRKLSTATNLIKPITTAIRSGGRINCNKYVQALLSDHRFIQNGKLIYGIIENVLKTVPPKYISSFIKGYTNSSISNDNSITLYETETVKTSAKSLKKVDIPKPKKQAVRTATTKKKTKHDYIKESIKQTQIGERGERLVLEFEKAKLLSALKEGKIESIENLLKWVSLEDDSAGYDILSYDVDKKSPIYIEVKATTSGKTTPFYISNGELSFSKNHSSNYRLYRVFNLRNDVAEFYELSGDISTNTTIELEGETYKVSLK